ncbi:YeiH family protein [Arthrobacter castelli]|uniref:YeiH family protein n=1 Tax=Arthrobacter castelli TaxID=271431 RepID=UPI000479DD6C|nr:putative sulfate exporter family transporter [Arthrobacter castelli]
MDSGGVRSIWPGLLACAAAAALSFLLHFLIPALPVMTTAVVLGILAANLPGGHVAAGGRLQPGLSYAGKHMMRAGVVLLGLKLSVMDVLHLGWETFAAIAGVVLLSFAGTYGIGRAFRLPGDQPLLMAAGFSICGASAVGAMSNARGTRQQDTVVPIALVTLCGTLAIAVLPLLMQPLGLQPIAFGRWVGASVHDVGQVVATAQTAGPAALAAAILIKLTRVLLLAPMVTAVAALTPRNEHGKKPPIIPLFVAGFIAMVAIRSFGLVGPEVLDVAGLVRDVLLAAALFGLGSAVRVRQLLTQGGKAMGTAMLSWLLIAALGYALILIIGG